MHLKRQTLKFSIPSDVFTAVPQNDRMNLVQYELVKERERGEREARERGSFVVCETSFKKPFQVKICDFTFLLSVIDNILVRGPHPTLIVIPLCYCVLSFHATSATPLTVKCFHSFMKIRVPWFWYWYGSVPRFLE